MRLFLLILVLVPGFTPHIALAAATSLQNIADIGSAGGMWAPVCAMLPAGACEGAAGEEGVSFVTLMVINLVMKAIGVAAVIIILYAAIRLITSAGNDETVRKAWKQMIFYALLGLIFALLADTIIAYVTNFIGNVAAIL